MILAVDANVPVGLLLRPTGLALILDSKLDLYIADVVWVETEHNLRRRIEGMLRYGRLGPADATVMLDEGLTIGRARLRQVDAAGYRGVEAVAHRRMPHDLTDWPTIAVALSLDAAIWTEDRHFHGCGTACWSTETLTREVAALPSA